MKHIKYSKDLMVAVVLNELYKIVWERGVSYEVQYRSGADDQL